MHYFLTIDIKYVIRKLFAAAKRINVETKIHSKKNEYFVPNDECNFEIKYNPHVPGSSKETGPRS